MGIFRLLRSVENFESRNCKILNALWRLGGNGAYPIITPYAREEMRFKALL